MPDHSFSEEIFPNIQSKPPLTQLESISSHPIADYLGEETNSHLATPSCQAVVESDKVSPQPPLLQTKQLQLPQPLLISSLGSYKSIHDNKPILCLVQNKYINFLLDKTETSLVIQLPGPISASSVKL